MSENSDFDVLRRALLDEPLTQIGDTPLQTQLKKPLRLGTLMFTPMAALSLRVFNRPEDRDTDAVFGGADAHISFDLQSAWVKYKLAVNATEKLSLGIALAKASGDVELSDYRIHDATSGAWTAISADLDSPRTLLSLEDVRALKPGEALAMELGGAVSTSVTLSWSDAIGAKLGEIVQGLVPRVPIAVKLRTGVEATAAVSVTDHFSLVISRTRDGHFRIAVKKAKSRDHSFGIDVSFGADLSAAPALDEALAAVFEALGPEGDREEAAAAELKQVLRARLVDAMRWKMSTGFAYEYARIDESTAIADFILLDDAQLDADYALAIAGDFAKLRDALRQDTGSRTLVRYLNETSLTRKSASGFSLGPLQAKDTSVFELTTRTSLDDFRLITARGTRRYTEKLIPGNDFEWTVDLKAQMTEFHAAPATIDFDYGLHYAVVHDDLERMLDFARMWGVRMPDRTLFTDGKATIRVQLRFDREALIATLGAFGSIEAWAAPLAAAMPYDERRDAYTAAWYAWLTDAPPVSLPPGLAKQFAWTSGDGHVQLRARLEAFMRGARELHECMTTEAEPERIGAAYNALQQFWSQRLYIAASGRYLLDRAAEAGAQVKATLQVEYEDETITA
ncbi:MAG: hypothetical protein ACJ74H_22055 [Thermoanaerobaculia bacterium]